MYVVLNNNNGNRKTPGLKENHKSPGEIQGVT